MLPKSRGLIEEVAGRLYSGSPSDYSASLVIFPGKRPAHFLRKVLGEAVGGSFIPPRVFSIDAFVDFIYEDGLGMFSPALETIDAVAILYKCHIRNTLTTRKDGDTKGWEGFVTPDSFFGVGLSIYRDIEELCIEKKGIAMTSEIEESFQQWCPLHSMQNIQKLSFFYEEFYKTITESRYSTRSLRYVTVSERIGDVDLSSFKKIIVAGFYGLTTSERDLFRHLGANSSVEFIFQDGPNIHERLRSLGVHDLAPLDDEQPEPQIEFYGSPDTHGQVFALNTLLKQSVEEPSERTVIALPSSETLFPLLCQSLCLLDEMDYNISLGYPLYRTPIYGFFNNLMQLITTMDGTRLYIHDYLKFVLHPYTKNILFAGRADITRVMFHTIEEEFAPNRAKTFFTLDELENDEELFDSIIKRLPESADIETIRGHLKHIHENTIKRLMSFHDTADFARQCIAILTYIYEQSTAPMHPFFYPFAEAFITTLHTIANSLMSDIQFAHHTGYFNLFRKYIATCYCPFPGTPLRGMQVLGFLETRNIKFDRVYILDLNEDVLPSAGLEESLLPFMARQKLGLPTAVDREKFSAYYLETLIAGAKEVHIFFVENGKKAKSRFVERLLWKKQKRDNDLDNNAHIQSIQYKIELKNNPPVPVIKTEAMIDILRNHIRYSASSLETYLVCPLRFYYKYVLRLDKKEKASQDIEPLDIGSFVHHVLAQYFKRYVGVTLTQRHIDQRYMLACLEGAFREFYGQEPSGAAYLLKQQVRRHLLDFLDNYTLPIVKRTNTMVKCVEEDISVNLGHLKLYGRLDRVDIRDGYVWVLDYKTSSKLQINLKKLHLSDRDSWSTASNCIQMPFYLFLYSEKFGITISGLRCAHIFLGRSVIDESIEEPFPQDAYEIITELLHLTLKEIINPSINLEPTKESKKVCPGCIYRCICGTY
ncbi:MAG: PD-(D/E)XK nuclease family protein [Nitrospirae bacterium]|nr:PD-(D/E)XK nuclease family protein [Nitrospirota bacterium]